MHMGRMSNMTIGWTNRISERVFKIVIKLGLARFILLRLIHQKKLLESGLHVLANNVDLGRLAQRVAEKKFFCVDESIIETILDGRRLNVFDAGAAGNAIYELERYRKFLHIFAVEPQPDDWLHQQGNDLTLIPNLVGGREGRVQLNITRKGMCSSILQPNLDVLNLWTSGDARRFEVVQKKEFDMTTIYSVLSETGRQIDYLKLDTQGTELDILKGMGNYRPIIIKTEISFLPLYKDQTIFYDLAKFLFDAGYAMFHLAYASKSSPQHARGPTPYSGTLIPVHGDAWFMPDWTRETGRKIFEGREREYRALMLIFGMGEIEKFVGKTLTDLDQR